MELVAQACTPGGASEGTLIKVKIVQMNEYEFHIVSHTIFFCGYGDWIGIGTSSYSGGSHTDLVSTIRM